jgi:hypothetical protein
MHAKQVVVFFAVSLLLLAACNRTPPPNKKEVSSFDRVDTKRVEPIHFLHKTFAVKKYAPFEFAVPAHAATPRLHGTFKSFVRRPGEDKLSDESADVDFILMNPEQYQDFLRTHGGGTALHTVEPTHDHEVEFLLSPTEADPQKYYIVFNNSPGGAALKYVQADFTLSFGY